MEPLRAVATQAPPSVPRKFFFCWIRLKFERNCVWPVDLQSCGLLEYSSGEKTKIGINGEPFICTYAELNCNLIHINRPFFFADDI
jgi:hypothetical protein